MILVPGFNRWPSFRWITVVGTGISGVDLGINPNNSRDILRWQLNMAPGSGLEAHHDLPICANEPDLEKEFLKRGIDPNKAEHGRPLPPEKHKLIHGKDCTGWPFRDPYRYQWVAFFEENANAGLDEIRAFRDQLRQITSVEFTSADELPWVYTKPPQ